MTVPRVRELRSVHAPDIIYFMETKNQDAFVLSNVQTIEYKHHFLISPYGLSGGLALFWRNEINLTVLSSSPNFIDTKVEYKSNEFYLTFIYGIPQQEHRGEFWEELSILGQGRDSAWALTGDFNDILNNSEKDGGPSRCEGSFIPLRSFVSTNGLWDVKHTGNELSWRGRRHTHDIKSRLDRTLANLAWAEMFPASCCSYLRFEGSNHRPLLTYLDTQKVKSGNHSAMTEG